MSLSLKTRKAGDVAILDLSGRLTIGEPVLLMRESLRALQNDGMKKYLLNLGEVSYIDSSGLGELVSTYTSMRNKGGDVKLLNLTNKVKDVMQMTKLITVFEYFDDEQKALQAFG